MKSKDINQMSLYDYVIEMFERHCDLTEGRRQSLDFYLSNCKARYVNVAEFKAVFGLESFCDVLSLISDVDRFNELSNYGMMCYQEWIDSKNKEISYGSVLEKV